MQTRRGFLKAVGSAAVTAGAVSILPGCADRDKTAGARRKRPNIIFVLTDDQGYGDLGCHGNNFLKTGHIDKFAGESVEFSQFYVSPVCSPTRASLLTGRYNYRTGVVDTWIGRNLMAGDEVTIAELLRDVGYATGVFGKWHLGDNYPLRSIDQGFEESIVHKGGALTTQTNPPGNNYFDPILQHNGKTRKFKGYCMDIYTDAAIKFVEQNKNKPFFVYLATNTPHVPLQISEEYAEPYRAMGLTEDTARAYGMITNIDDNFGRLLAKLKELKLADETIVIFMSDNGPCGGSVQTDRYMADLRGLKGWVYENGIRVPCFIRWPSGFKGGRKTDRIAAHIDIMPTLLEACGAKKPANVKLDGVSLMPLLSGDDADWPDRTLYLQWHNADEPELYICFAARNQRYKLVQAQGIKHKTVHQKYIELVKAQGRKGQMPTDEFKFELFDMAQDPFEQNDISAEHPEIVEQMKRGYAKWFVDVSSSRGYEPPRIVIGTKYENPTVLTRQDWRGTDNWTDKNVGYWQVKLANTGSYLVKVILSKTLRAPGRVYFKFGDVKLKEPLRKCASEVKFKNVQLQKGLGKVEAWAEVEREKLGVRFVNIERLD